MTVFVDSSVWYAAADRSDRNHARAKELLSESERFLTTDHVIVEVWRLISHRLNRHAAEAFAAGLRPAGVVIESATLADLEVAVNIGTAFPDQTFSLVDRTCFAVMVRLGVTTALSFDIDFSVFRFGPSRQQAFTVRG